jgi:hypothetical protein
MNAAARPKLSLPLTPRECLVEAVGAVLIATLVIMAGIELARLPEPVPLDFDANGSADAWGTRSVLALVPGVALIVYVGLSALQLFPESYHYRMVVTEANAAALYRKRRWLVRGAKVVLTLISAMLFFATVNAARESTELYELCFRLDGDDWQPARCLPNGG